MDCDYQCDECRGCDDDYDIVERYCCGILVVGYYSGRSTTPKKVDAEEAVKAQVKSDWVEGDVRDLVDEILGNWDDEHDEDDNDEEEDEYEED